MCRLPVVLVVDTDRDNREMYVEYLRKKNYDADETADGREALAKAIARQPDIVVTETRLIGISGYDLCRLLRRDETTYAIPIVVVTGDGHPAVIEQAERAGADTVLVKPCLPEAVLTEIGRLLERSRELRAQSATARGRAAAHAAKAQKLVQQPLQLNRPIARKNRTLDRRFTTAPPIVPPELRCPTCDRRLVYERSHIGGVSALHVEQWDYFECPGGCGKLQYRQRTRKLRKVV